MGSATQSCRACREGQALCALTCEVNGPPSLQVPCLLEKGCWTNCRYKTWVSGGREQVSEFMANDHVCAFEQKLRIYKTYQHRSMTASYDLDFFDEISGDISVRFWYYVTKCVTIRKISVSCCKFVHT